MGDVNEPLTGSNIAGAFDDAGNAISNAATSAKDKWNKFWGGGKNNELFLY